jgi:hypothetical protein
MVDNHQDVARISQQTPGFTVVQMSADYAWMSPQGKLILVEEKKPSDLDTSVRLRRLQRQLRTNLQVADIAVLALRCVEDGRHEQYWFESTGLQLSQLAQWQLWGQMVMLPSGYGEVLEQLTALRSIIGEPHASRGILAGNDKRRPKARNPFDRAVMRLIDGVGPRTARVLRGAWDSDLLAFMQASDESLLSSGLHRGQLRKLREYVQ